MPTYVYECKTCHKVIEVEQRITADPLTDCDCGAKGSLKRVMQPTAVMFKGSGFYVNDSTPKPAKSKEEPAKVAAESSDTATPAATTTETPAATPTPAPTATPAKTTSES